MKPQEKLKCEVCGKEVKRVTIGKESILIELNTNILIPHVLNCETSEAELFLKKLKERFEKEEITCAKCKTTSLAKEATWISENLFWCPVCKRVHEVDTDRSSFPSLIQGWLDSCFINAVEFLKKHKCHKEILQQNERYKKAYALLKRSEM